MAPESEISFTRQIFQIESWAKSKGGKCVSSSSNSGSLLGCEVWVVDEKPVVIYTKGDGSGNIHCLVSCDDGYTKELEGIVNFSESEIQQ